MNDFKNKSIIIGIPDHFELPKRFKENLEFLGFQVFSLECNSGKVNIALKHRIIHIYKKIVLSDKTYKRRRRAIAFENKQIEFIRTIPEKVDYALFIRPDLFSQGVILETKKKARMIVAYQWDGLDRFPLVKDLIEYFDRFFVFDVRDLNHNKYLLPTTNFYFDDIITSDKAESDVFFVGTYMKNRHSALEKLVDILSVLKLNMKILVLFKDYYSYNNINVIKKGLNFKENIEYIKSSKVIIDLKNDIHYGLSFRTFESLGFGKKLITNNELVKYYDFYNENNIFVFRNENFDGLEEFLNSPYESLPKEIIEKYSFTNWLKYVLLIDPHYPLLLQNNSDKSI